MSYWYMSVLAEKNKSVVIQFGKHMVLLRKCREPDHFNIFLTDGAKVMSQQSELYFQ